MTLIIFYYYHIIMSDIKNLNKWGKQKNIFKIKAGVEYVNLLSKLVDEKFDFTRAHFDNLMEQTEYMYDSVINRKICKYMFDKFDLTQIQVDNLCNKGWAT